VIAPLRWSPAASVLADGGGVIVRTDLESFALDGDGVPALMDDLRPLLDGSRDIEAVVAALDADTPGCVLLGAGHFAHQLCLAASALDLGSLLVGGFVDDEVHRLFGQGETDLALCLVAVGPIGPAEADQI
jgi:Nitroreductase family